MPAAFCLSILPCCGFIAAGEFVCQLLRFQYFDLVTEFEEVVFRLPLGGDFHYTTEPEGFPDIQDRFFAEDRFPLIIGLAGIFSHVCAITLLLWQKTHLDN